MASDESGTLERIAEEIGAALLWLDALLAPENIPTIFVELGLDEVPALASDAALMQTLADVAAQASLLVPQLEQVSAARELDDTAALVESVGQLLTVVEQIVQAIDNVATAFKTAAASAPNAADLTAFAERIAGRVLENIVVRYMEAHGPLAAEFLALLTVIEYTERELETSGATQRVLRRRLHFDRVQRVFSDPLDVFREGYGWGDETFDGRRLFRQLASLFEQLGLIAANQDPEVEEEAALEMAEINDQVLDLFGLRWEVTGDAHPPGIQGRLFLDAPDTLDLTVLQLNDQWRVALQSSAALAADTKLRLLPPAQLEVESANAITGDVAFALLGKADDSAAAFPLVGETDGSRIEAREVRIAAAATFTWSAAANKATGDVGFEASFRKARVVIAAAKSDAFLQRILPADGLTLDFDVDIGWTAARGFFFKGSASLELAVALNQTVGPFRIDTLHLEIAPHADGLVLAATVDGGGALGPVAAVVERIGVEVELAFGRGNLGLVDLAVGFRFPRGLGLSIDAGPITGGGFLELDPANGRYAGVVALSLYGISIKAIGLLDTQLGPGQSGFSFLIIVTAEFSPIQLGFGFTLNGVGGLAGINRTILTDAIQAGLRTQALDRILFPADPVRDAPLIIGDLRTIFPPTPNRHAFGPMLLVGWGTPTLIEARIGIMLVVPEPILLAILGQITVALPDKNAAVVEIHADVLGVIDFAKKQFALDARLHDSHIAMFSVDGDMAMRVCWGDRPMFVLSVGGFNPHFRDVPAGFPDLKRLTIGYGAGEKVRLTVQTYLAVTSNSFQIGAHAELYVGVRSFNVYGWLGFDALIVFSPFSFTVDFVAGLALRRGTHTLFGITVRGTLSGPTPWRAQGEAHFSILFFDIGVHFNVTWGESRANALPSASPWDPLRLALLEPRNWSGSLPAGDVQVVSLSPPEGALAPVLVEPAGVLTFRQKVLPLNRTLTKFGEATPVGQTTFTVGDISVNGRTVESLPVADQFAPGQFEQLNDADKLSRPSFEAMDAGFSVGAGAIEIGAPFDVDIAFDTTIVDPLRREIVPPRRYGLAIGVCLGLSRQSGLSARGVRGAGLAAFAPAGGRPRLAALSGERYVVATVDTLTRRDDVGGGTKDETLSALARHLAAHPSERGTLQVVPASELRDVA
jgi:hypothetical protein